MPRVRHPARDGDFPLLLEENGRRTFSQPHWLSAPMRAAKDDIERRESAAGRADGGPVVA